MIMFWIIIVTVSLRRASFTFALLWGKTRKHFRQYFNRDLWNGFLNDRNLSTSIWPDQKAKCKMTLICLNFWMKSRGSDWLLTFIVFISSQGFSILRHKSEVHLVWVCNLCNGQCPISGDLGRVPGGWVVGGGYSHSQAADAPPPTHQPPPRRGPVPWSGRLNTRHKSVRSACAASEVLVDNYI